MKIIIKISLCLIIIGFTSILYGQYFRGKLACSHCGVNKMDREFLRQLKFLENKCSFDFKINSGYRCRFKNRQVGGDEASKHLYGLAVDIGNLNFIKRCELETHAEISGYFTKFYKYNAHVHIEAGGYGWISEWKKYPSDVFLSSLRNNIFGGVGIKYTMIEDESAPHASLRLGYFLADQEYEENLFYFMDIVSDKLINNSTSDVAQNQIALGAGLSSFEDPYYYGLNLSAGLGFLTSVESSDKQEKDTYYFVEPGINFGFLFQYIDCQINLGYTFTKGVSLGTLDDNNVGGFYVTVVASLGRFRN